MKTFLVILFGMFMHTLIAVIMHKLGWTEISIRQQISAMAFYLFVWFFIAKSPRTQATFIGMAIQAALIIFLLRAGDQGPWHYFYIWK